MLLSSPSQIPSKTVRVAGEKGSDLVCTRVYLPPIEQMSTVQDLESLIAQLDSHINFANVHRFITEDIDEVRFLTPWLNREYVLDKAAKIFDMSHESWEDIASKPPSPDLKRWSELYLTLFTVHVILHDKKLQPSMLRSLRTVGMCLCVLIGPHVNKYRMRSFSPAEACTPRIDEIAENIMALDAFVHEFDRLELFKDYGKEKGESLLKDYVLPRIPKEYSVEICIRNGLLSREDTVVGETMEPRLKTSSNKEALHVPTITEYGNKVDSTGYFPFNFYSLKTSALSVFDVSTYTALAGLRFSLYKDLLANMIKEQIFEREINSFHRLLSVLLNAAHGAVEDEAQVSEYINNVADTVAKFIVYTRICSFYCEQTRTSPFSLTEIPLLSSPPSASAGSPGTSGRKSGVSVAYISRVFRSVMATIALHMPQLLHFLARFLDNSSVVHTYTRILDGYKAMHEKLVMLVEELLLCRMSLGFMLLSIHRDAAEDMLAKAEQNLNTPPDLNANVNTLTHIERELILGFHYIGAEGGEINIEYKCFHRTLAKSIDVPILYSDRLVQCQIAKEQKIIDVYGVIPHLFHGIVCYGSFIKLLLLGKGDLLARYVLQLIEPVYTLISTTLSTLRENDRHFCRTQLVRISSPLKRFSQSLEALLTDLHGPARAIIKSMAANVQVSTADPAGESDNAANTVILQRKDTYLHLVELLFKSLQSILSVGVIIVDQKLFIMGLRYITSYVSDIAFYTSCRLLKQLLVYKEMQKFVKTYTIDGLPVSTYLTERTRLVLGDSNPVCMTALTALIEAIP